jgi:hypothetical protein
MTLKSTKIHTQALTENNRIVSVLQVILREQSSSSEKLKLLGLKTLRELAASGYHMVLLDMSLLSLLMRFLHFGRGLSSQTGEGVSCLHQASLEVFQALISST